MTDMLDLGPQTRLIARLAEGVRDDQLDGPTPCPDYAVRHLLGHLTGLTVAFRAAAAKELGPLTDTDPQEGDPDITEDWRTVLPKVLDELVEAWRDPAAYEGMTRAGGVDLPGEVAALVVADELAVHGWDLARATGQDYDPDPAVLGAAHAMLGQFADADPRPPIFGPVVPVPDSAPLLDRVIGLSGRDPQWAPQG